MIFNSSQVGNFENSFFVYFTVHLKTALEDTRVFLGGGWSPENLSSITVILMPPEKYRSHRSSQNFFLE